MSTKCLEPKSMACFRTSFAITPSTAVRYLDENTALKYVFKVHKKVEGVKGDENKLHFIIIGVVDIGNIIQNKKID